MQLVYVLATLLAASKVIADPTIASTYKTPKHIPTALPPLPPNSSIFPGYAPPANITLPDGTNVTVDSQSCWTEPAAPPIASNSSEYAHGTCNVCVSQTLQDVLSFPTTGSLSTYHVQIRDNNNHDMGTANQTLAAYGAETAGRQTRLALTAGGKQFHLWSMRDPGFPKFNAVYMDYGGPGPENPFMQPMMVFDAADEWGGTVGLQSCSVDGASPDGKRVYFQCGFSC